MRLIVKTLLVFLLLTSFACSDPETVFRLTLEGLEDFLEAFQAVRLYPGQERPHLQMIEFLDEKAGKTLSGLSELAKLRENETEKFWDLFEKNRESLIAVFRKIDVIDKREKLLLACVGRLFAPREDGFELASFEWERGMLKSWWELLLKDSRQVLR